MNVVATNQVGEAWKSFLQRDELSWCSPSRIDPGYFARHGESEWIRKLLKHTGLQNSSSKRILEAGCGTAMYGLSLAVLGFTVDAFDYNEEAIVFARKLEAQARQVKPQLQIRLYRGNILEIDAAANNYDLVFNQAVLDYFCAPVERKQAIREMTRVTKPGKWVAAIVQHTGHPFRKYWERLGWRGYVDQPAVAMQTPPRLIREFKDAGLRRVTVDGIYPWKAFFFWPPWYKRWKWTENLVYVLGQILNRTVLLPRPLRSHLAIQFLVVGQKP